MTRLYYTPPTDEEFEELKEKAIKVWEPMGSEPSYAQGKIGKIEDMKNIGDNFMYIVAMFDYKNQEKLSEKLSQKTKKAVRDRMIDGGIHPSMIPF